MADEQENLENLSQSWLKKVGEIRSMVMQDGPSGSDGSTESSGGQAVAENVPSAEELFSVPISEEIPENQIFASDEIPMSQIFEGDDGFYKTLKTSSKPKLSIPFKKEVTPAFIGGEKHFSLIQKAIAAAILLIGVTLLYNHFSPLIKSDLEPIAETSETEEIVTKTAKIETGEEATGTESERTQYAESIQIKKPLPVLDATQPLSLNIAQNLYLSENYGQASLVFEKLLENLPPSQKDDLLRDCIKLQIALCNVRTSEYAKANRQLRGLLTSNSPAVRVLANYHSGLLEMQQKEYLNARSKAYRAIALIDAIEFDKNWGKLLKKSCYFLAAEAMTKKTLMLCDADKDLPVKLWSTYAAADEVLIGFDEVQLRSFLASGTEKLNQSILGPRIEQLQSPDEQLRFSVTCNGAPTEELLIRLAANFNGNLKWELNSEDIGIRKRRLYLHLDSATIQNISTVAGSAGLIANIDNNNLISIINPARYSLISEHIKLTRREASSLWQKILLWFPEESKFANIHFSLALLHSSANRYNEAMAEYKLISNRYANSSLAPESLLNSSRIKNQLHDYSGSRMDLKQLVEQFPESEVASTAYLYLAENTAKSNLKSEAVRLYKKVYNTSPYIETQLIAALAIGKYSYETQDIESSTKWLERYIELTKDNQTDDVYSAYCLLGKSYLKAGKVDSASTAFEYGLQGGPAKLGKEEYMESISSIIETYMQQENFVKALDILENVHTAILTQSESTKFLLLKSKALRQIGLIDKAIAKLSSRVDFTTEPNLKAQVRFELSKCYIEKGSDHLAYEELTDILLVVEPGRLAHEVSYSLGQVCMNMGRNKQAISIFSQLLDLEPEKEIQQETLSLIAKAYNKEQNYDKAALTLLGQWK